MPAPLTMQRGFLALGLAAAAACASAPPRITAAQAHRQRQSLEQAATPPPAPMAEPVPAITKEPAPTPIATPSDDSLREECERQDSPEACMEMAERGKATDDWTKSKVRPYRERAFTIWDAGCEKRDFVSCNRLAEGFSEGDWEVVDLPRLADVAEWVCDVRSVPEACDMLARGYDNGRFGNDPGRSERYGGRRQAVQEERHRSARPPALRDLSTQELRNRCDTHNAEACRTLAERLLGNDLHTRHDPRSAAFLLDRACDLGDGLACEELAEMYRNGHDVPRDARRADDLSARARWLRNEP